MRLIEDLFCYIWTGRGNNCHSYVFKDVLPGKRPHVIVDTGYVSTGVGQDCLSILCEAMKADQINPAEIGFILNTHSHSDHCHANQPLIQMGLDCIPDEPPARIAMTREEEHFHQTIGGAVQKDRGLKMDFKVGHYLEEGVLSLGEGENRLKLEVMLTPGHSPGSASFYWAKHKALITGDVVFNHSIGRTDFPGGDSKAMRESIEKLSKVDARYLLPGHDTAYGNIIEGKERIEENFTFIRESFYHML